MKIKAIIQTTIEDTYITGYIMTDGKVRPIQSTNHDNPAVIDMTKLHEYNKLNLHSIPDGSFFITQVMAKAYPEIYNNLTEEAKEAYSDDRTI